MPSVQIRNNEATDIQGADVIRNGYQFMHEPIGGFAIWNGQFQLGSDPFPAEGWQTYSSVGTAYWNRQTNGVAGLYCARGGAVAMAIGPTICTLRYMPVDEDEDYDIECVARGKTANSRYSMGALCYDSAKAYIGTSWALANDTPGVAYVRESKTIGPTGDVAWVANTQYARPCWALQDDATLTDEWIEIDDCQFHHSVGVAAATIPRSVTLALNSFTTSKAAAVALLMAHGTAGVAYAPYAWRLDLNLFAEINIRFRLPLDWDSGAISCSIDYDSLASTSEDPAMRIYWSAISAGESTVADPAFIATDTLSIGMAPNILYQHTFTGTITPTAEEMIHLTLRSHIASVSQTFYIYIYAIRINYTAKCC